MVLDSLSSHPHARCYVLKLHRDATPAGGRMFGRIEHIASGEAADFDSPEALVAWLGAHLDPNAITTEEAK